VSNGGGLWLPPPARSARGEGRGGGSERRGDDLDDRVDAREHVVVPEAQDAVLPLGEPSSASSVLVLGLHVLAAVELDDEAPLGAGEVRDVWTDGMLAAET